MKLTVKNFRGCKSAKIDIAPIALIAGLNHEGKSSVALAARAALMGDVLTTKTNAAMLVHDGADAGSALVSDGKDIRFKMNWPKGDHTSKGRLHESDIAAGGVRFGALKSDELAARLSEVVGLTPTRDDVAKALSDEGFGEKVIEAVWQQIDESEWDGAMSKASETGAKLKARWTDTTGRSRYGNKIADGWKPDDVADEIADGEVTLEDLKERVVRANGALERALRDAGASAADRDRLTEAVGPMTRDDGVPDELASLRDRRAELESQDKELEAAIGALDQERRDIESREGPKIIVATSCPCCSEQIVVTAKRSADGATLYDIAKGDAPELLDRTESGRALAENGEARAAKSKDQTTVRQQITALTRDIVNRESALEQLNALPEGADNTDDIEAARTAIAVAQKDVSDFESIAKAATLHKSIGNNDTVQKMLKPDGLRRDVLVRRLDEFLFEHVQPLCNAAKFAPITINDELMLTYGGHPYQLLASDSERYRMDAILSLAIAQIDGSALVIFDGADMLDPAGRNGLFKAIKAAGVKALVCMTIFKGESVPDLAKSGLGRSYWVHAGVVEPLGKSAAAATS